VSARIPLHLGLRGRIRRLREAVFLWRWRRRIGAREFARFGERSLVVHPLRIIGRDHIEIGDDVLIHEGAIFSVVDHFRGRDHQPRLRIGDRTNIGPRISFSCVGEIEVGEDILMAHDILITDSYHEFHDPDVPILHQPMAWPQPVNLGAGCFVGAHAVILGGVTVGANAFIGAGAVVTESVPPNCVVVGNPAKVVRHYDRARGAWIDGPPGVGPDR
jgi:acetyltransferase-like isoleucine patch superfamily enzyme